MHEAPDEGPPISMLHAVERRTAQLLALFVVSAVGLVVFGVARSLWLPIGVAVGGGIGLANFWALRSILLRVMGGRPTMLLALAGKFLAIAAAIYGVVVYTPVDMRGFTWGLTAAFLSIVWETLAYSVRRLGTP